MTWESSMDNWHLYGLWWQHGPWKSFQAAQLRKWTNLHFILSLPRARAIVWLDLKFSTRACTSFSWPYSTGTWSCTSSASLPHLSPGGGGGGCCCLLLLVAVVWLIGFWFCLFRFLFLIFLFVCFFPKSFTCKYLLQWTIGLVQDCGFWSTINTGLSLKFILDTLFFGQNQSDAVARQGIGRQNPNTLQAATYLPDLSTSCFEAH